MQASSITAAAATGRICSRRASFAYLSVWVVSYASMSSGDTVASIHVTLPPLKLSMHVFADEPAQRFVILDGRRQGEGASPAAGVVIEEIRRDGVVLSASGRRLLLPRP